MCPPVRVISFLLEVYIAYDIDARHGERANNRKPDRN